MIRRLAAATAVAALGFLPASAATAAPPPAPAGPVTRVVARDVVAGRTGVWLLSQVTEVSGPRSGPTLTPRGARLERIDPSTGRVIARIGIPITPERLVQGWSGRLWVTGSRLVQVDPRTRRARLVGGPCEDLVADGRPGVWTGSTCTGTLTRRSATGRRIGSPVAIPGPRPVAIALGDDGLFVTRATLPARVERRDPRTGRVLAQARVGRPPDGLVLRGGSVWALGSATGTLDRLDPVTLRRTARIGLPFRGAGGAHLAVGGGATWVIDQYDGRIARIDPRTERPRVRPLTRVPPETLPIAVATGRRSVWVVMQGDGTRSALCRLDPAGGSVERCFLRST